MPSHFFGEENPLVPNEILVKIFSYLSYRDIFLTAKSVSKIWCESEVIEHIKDKLVRRLKDDLWDAVQSREISLSDALELADMSMEHRKKHWLSEVDGVALLRFRYYASPEYEKALCSNDGMIFKKMKLATAADIFDYAMHRGHEKLPLLFSKASRYLMTNQLTTFQQMISSIGYLMDRILSEYPTIIISLLSDKLITAQDIINFAPEVNRWPSYSYIENLPKLNSERGRECLKKKLITVSQGLKCCPYLLQMILSDKGINYLERQLFTMTEIIECDHIWISFEFSKISQANVSYCLEHKLLTIKQLSSFKENLQIILSDRCLGFLKAKLVSAEDLVNLTKQRGCLDTDVRYADYNWQFDTWFKQFSSPVRNYYFENTKQVLAKFFFNDLTTAFTPQVGTFLLSTYLTTQLPAVTDFLKEIYAVVTASESPSVNDILFILRSFLKLYGKYSVNNGFSYFQMPLDSLNQHCLAIARTIAKPGESIGAVTLPGEILVPVGQDWVPGYLFHDEFDGCFKPKYHLLSKNRLIPILNFLELKNRGLLTQAEAIKIKYIAGNISKDYFNALKIIEKVSLYGKLKKIADEIVFYDYKTKPPALDNFYQYWDSLSEKQRKDSGSLQGFCYYNYGMRSLEEILASFSVEKADKNERNKLDLYSAYHLLYNLLQDDYCFDVLIKIAPAHEQALLDSVDLKQLRILFESELNNLSFSPKKQGKVDFTLLNDLVSVLTLTLPGHDVTQAADMLRKIISKHQPSFSPSMFLDIFDKLPPKNRIIAIKSCLDFIKLHINDAIFFKDILKLLPEEDWHIFTALTGSFSKSAIATVKLHWLQATHFKRCVKQAEKAMSVVDDAKPQINKSTTIALKIADVFYSYAHPPLFSSNWRAKDLQNIADNIAQYLRANCNLSYEECKDYILKQTKDINKNPYGTFQGLLYLLEYLNDQEIKTKHALCSIL